MTTVALAYECDLGMQPTALLVGRVTLAPTDRGELAAMGLTVLGNVVVQDPSNNKIVRTITLQVSPTGPFQTDDELKDITRGLWTDSLALYIPARVTASEPVVTP